MLLLCSKGTRTKICSLPQPLLLGQRFSEAGQLKLLPCCAEAIPRDAREEARAGVHVPFLREEAWSNPLKEPELVCGG